MWTSWGGEPGVIVAIAVAAAAYASGVRALWRRAGVGRGVPRWRVTAFSAGLATIAIALLSPLDALGETLFSAHMVQHLLLMMLAPPLLVLGMPHVAAAWLLPPRRLTWLRQRHATRGLLAVWHGATTWPFALGSSTAALWLWHAPRLYTLALERPWVHALEHLSFIATAILLWWRILLPRHERRSAYAIGVLLLLATSMESGALGAVLAFAREPWFPIQAAGARAWGITPLEDQQLAGLIMWVPGGLFYIAAAGALFATWLANHRAPSNVAVSGGIP